MGRPRSFEESEVLQTAMVAFWRNGSADTICRALHLEPATVHRWAKRLKLPLKSNVRRIRRTTPP